MTTSSGVEPPRSPAACSRGSISWRTVTLGIVLLFVAAAAWFSRPVALTSQIDAAIRRHDWPAALAALETLERREPDRPDVAFRRARILRRQDRLAEAARAFDAAGRLGHDTEQLHRQLVLMKAQAGRMTSVESEIQTLLGAEVDDLFAEECYEALVKGHLAGHRIDDARQCVAFWTEWQPENPLAHAAAGLVAEKLERHGEALSAYRTALSLDPDDVALRGRVAALEVHAGRLDTAAEEYALCLERQPDDARILIGLADCHVRRGAHEMASRLLHEALTIDLTPENEAVALTALAGLAAEERQMDAAVALYGNAVRLDPRSITARFGYAAVLNALGRRDEASHHLAEAQKLSDAHRRLTALTRQTVGEPRNADLRVDIAGILADLGLREEGTRWLEAALEIDPDHARARHGLDTLEPEAGGKTDDIPGPIHSVTKGDT